MKTTSLLASALSLAALAGNALAHPGAHEHHDDIGRLWRASKRSLAACSTTPAGRRLKERALERRSALAADLRQKLGLTAKRDLDSVLGTSHDSSKTFTGSNSRISYNAKPSLLFGGDDYPRCVLAPEVTQGPYYVTGEYVRYDVREGHDGVDLYLDLQFIDISTCKPVPNIYVDIWNVNATGVYSGVVAKGNGDASDLSNLNATFLRGLRATNDDGVVQFLTIFPGHYSGRTHHTHLMAHQGGYETLNGTFSGGKTTHTGQIFYDSKLSTEVEKLEPYVHNTQPLTTNDDDSLLAGALSTSSGDTEFDPFVRYVRLGDKLEHGILGWLSIGSDTTQTHNVSYAATLTEFGGVANSDSSTGGDAPSGSPPAGAKPS